MTKKLLSVLMITVLVMTAGISSVTAESVDEADKYGFDEPVYIKIGHAIDPTFEYKEGEDVGHNQWVYLYQDHNIMPVILFDVDAS